MTHTNKAAKMKVEVNKNICIRVTVDSSTGEYFNVQNSYALDETVFSFFPVDQSNEAFANYLEDFIEQARNLINELNDIKVGLKQMEANEKKGF